MNKKIRFFCYGMIITGFMLVAMAAYYTDYTMYSDEIKLILPINVIYDNEMTRNVYFDVSSFSEMGQDIVFFSNHQFIRAYADGEEIYSNLHDGGIWGRTTGSMWNFVAIPYGAEEIRINITAAYESGEDDAYYFYAGNKLALYKTIFSRSVPTMITSLLIILIGAVMIVCGIILNKKVKTDRSMLYLGIFAAILGLWSLNETNAAALMWENRVSSSFTAYILLMNLSFPFMLFVKEFMKITEKWIWKVICILSMADFAAVIFMQFFNIADFKETVFLTHIVIVSTLFYVSGTLVYKFVTRQIDKNVKMNLLSVVILTASTLADIALYYIGYADSDLVGRIGFLLFILILGGESVSDALVMIEKGRKARFYEELAVTDMLTGFLNRNAYETEMKKRKECSNELLFTFDLNNLKLCNDTKGHSEGDNYIIKASQMIEKVFAPYGYCYRIGGDEFYVLINDAGRCHAEKLVKQLEAEEKKYNSIDGNDFPIHIACGYAVYDKETDSNLEDTRYRADAMMYENKRKIKGQNGL